MSDGPAVFEKKPVMVEAVRLHTHRLLKTPEGTMEGKPGDWLITGVEGEQYPCKDSVFRKTYRPVNELAQRMMDAGGLG